MLDFNINRWYPSCAYVLGEYIMKKQNLIFSAQQRLGYQLKYTTLSLCLGTSESENMSLRPRSEENPPSLML